MYSNSIAPKDLLLHICLTSCVCCRLAGSQIQHRDAKQPGAAEARQRKRPPAVGHLKNRFPNLPTAAQQPQRSYLSNPALSLALGPLSGGKKRLAGIPAPSLVHAGSLSTAPYAVNLKVRPGSAGPTHKNLLLGEVRRQDNFLGYMSRRWSRRFSVRRSCCSPLILWHPRETETSCQDC